MTKEDQSKLFQDQLLLVEEKIKKVTSALSRLEKSLRQLKIQFAEGGKKDEKYFLLKSELERAEKSVRICGHLYRMLFAKTNFPTVNLFDLEDAFSLDDEPSLPFDEEFL